MKLILYNPPSSTTKKPVLPLSLLALGAVLEGHYDYQIIDGNLEDQPVGTLSEIIRQQKIDILACTVMPGPQLSHAAPLCRTLKERYPHLITVWGGYFPTQHWDVCLQAPYVDYVVRGHGELVFKELLDHLQAGKNPDAIAGLALRRSESSCNAPAAIPDPDQMPEFPYHRVPIKRYVRRTFMGSRTLPHHSSYGCPFFCNFCAVVNMVNGRWLAQSAERTANTVRYLAKSMDLNSIEFYDNNFFTNEARVVEFADRIEDLKLGWWGEARIDTMLKFSEHSWRKLANAGLRMVFLGAESGSDATLQRMDKGGTATAAKTLEIAARMKQYDIVPELSFVLGNPPEPEADAKETMAFIRKVKKVNSAAEIIMYFYTPVPLAGELYDRAKADGFEFPQTLEEWISPQWQEFTQRRSATMPWVEDPLRKRMLDFERVLNAFYPTTTDMKLTQPKRVALKAASAWRYHLQIYRGALELRALQKWFAYQRPETSGF